MRVFLVACFTSVALLIGTAGASSVGFYSGLFDPPTDAQLRMIGCALGDPGFPPACQEIAAQISRLEIIVDEDSESRTIASARERVLMLEQALQKYGTRVTIAAATPTERAQRRRDLIGDKNIDQLFQLAGATSYKTLKPAPAGAEHKLAAVLFPLSEEALSPDELRRPGPSVDRQVNKVISKLGLYQPVSNGLANLQRSLFEEGWKDFLDDLRLACPITLDYNKCGQLALSWESIAIVTDDRQPSVTEETRLTYRQTQSEDRWAEEFVRVALAPIHGSGSYQILKPVAADIAARTFQGFPYGKLPHLRRVAKIEKKNSSTSPLQVERSSLECSAPRGPYSTDMEEYVADRLPSAFVAFIKAQLRSGTISPSDLYVHDHSLQQAYELHRRDGYDTFYFLQTRRGQAHRNIYIALKAGPPRYRVVITDVRGKDRAANVFCQIRWPGVFTNYWSVRSRNPEPLFLLNTAGDSLKLSRNDWLLFGFKGNWSRMLMAHQWQRTPLVKEGLDIDLFTHPLSARKIVVARNVYGDDAEIVLSTLYRKGLRRILYLGSAGAIADYDLGVVVVPTEIVDRHSKFVPFRNHAAEAYYSELAKSLSIHTRTTHAWAQSLFDETTAVLLGWQAQSAVSVDVEGIYLARFVARHRDVDINALFIISDQTLGEATIEETNAHRILIDQSVQKLISFFLPKVVSGAE